VSSWERDYTPAWQKNATSGVNFINVLLVRFSYEILAPKLQSCVLGLKL